MKEGRALHMGIRLLGLLWICLGLYSLFLDLTHLSPLWMGLPSAVSSGAIVIGGYGLTRLMSWARLVLLLGFLVPFGINCMDGFFFLYHGDVLVAVLLLISNLAAVGTLVIVFLFWPERRNREPGRSRQADVG